VKECSRNSIIEPIIINLRDRDRDTDTVSDPDMKKSLSKTETYVFDILHG
jgi:hypothetical protein